MRFINLLQIQHFSHQTIPWSFQQDSRRSSNTSPGVVCAIIWKKNEYLSIVFDNEILLFPGETVLLPLQLFFLFAHHHREPQLVHHHQAAATSHSGDEVRVHQEPIEQRENYWDSYSCRHARSRNNVQDRALTVGSPRTGISSNV